MPTYGPTQFKSVDPGSGEILIYFITGSAGSHDTASQCNVSTEDCFGNNRTSDIANLTKITISNTAGTLIDLPLINGTAYSTHYNFDIDPDVYFPSESITTGSCLEVAFDPSPFIDFSTNEYNATLNNTEQDRTSAYIFNIDSQRSGSTARPLNYQQIIDGTAVTASVQDSFYTDSGIINARFDGSETTTAEYGISPALSGKTFSAAVFDFSTDIVTILSSSQNNNVEYKEYIFTVDEFYNYGVSSGHIYHVRGTTTTDSPNARFITLMHGVENHGGLGLYDLPFDNDSGSLIISGARRYHKEITNSSGLLKFVKPFDFFGSFEVGEPFMIGTGNDAAFNLDAKPNFEFLTFLSSSLNTGGNTPSAYETEIFFETGSRNYPEKILGQNIFSGSDNSYSTLNTGSDAGLDVGRRRWNGYRPAIFKVISDSVYESQGSRLAKIKDKFMLVEETQEIMVIDQNGKIIFNMGSSL